MKKVILPVAIIFLFAALLPNVQQEGITNPFYAYFLYAAQIVSQNYFIFILGFIVVTIIVIRSLHFEKGYPRHKHYSVATFQVVNAFIVGVFIAYAVLLSIAFIELNILSIAMHINKNLMGVVSDETTIINTLRRNNRPPQIVASDKGENRELVAIASTISGKDNFYGNYILSTIPHFLVIPVQFDSSALLIDDTLIMTELNENDLEKISPTLGYLLVQKYFAQRAIRFYPKISIMTQKEYETLRRNDFKENLVKINQEIKKSSQLKTSTASTIQENKNRLLSYKNNETTTKAQNESTYKKCLADGKLTLTYCKNLRNGLPDPTLQDAQIADLTKQIASDESKLKGYQANFDLSTSLGKSVGVLSKNIPHELGLFLPEDSIRIVFSTENSHKIADYLETMVHEYIHYASHLSNSKKLSDTFFEEGLTEYFARQVIQDDLNVNTNIGYPMDVKIIREMAKNIVDSDLEDIYFTKDQALLEETLDKVYGAGFYKNSRVLFLTLQYTSNYKQALKSANEIMKRMGSNTRFTVKDLF